jgi:hypothetical protein
MIGEVNRTLAAPNWGMMPDQRRAWQRLILVRINPVVCSCLADERQIIGNYNIFILTELNSHT